MTYAKTAVFFLVVSFANKALFFQTIESAKRAFSTRAGSGKPAFFHALFLENRRKTAVKITGQCFPINSKVTYKNLLCGGKKKKKTA